MGSMDSLENMRMLRVQGIPQYSKEVQETSLITQVCHMDKLHENTDTMEVEDVTSINFGA